MVGLSSFHDQLGECPSSGLLLCTVTHVEGKAVTKKCLCVYLKRSMCCVLFQLLGSCQNIFSDVCLTVFYCCFLIIFRKLVLPKMLQMKASSWQWQNDHPGDFQTEMLNLWLSLYSLSAKALFAIDLPSDCWIVFCGCRGGRPSPAHPVLIALQAWWV